MVNGDAPIPLSPCGRGVGGEGFGATAPLAARDLSSVAFGDTFSRKGRREK